MTQADSRSRVRRLLDQEDTSNTQFDQNVIDDIVDQARRYFATILPEKRLLNLHAGDTGTISVSAGFAAYPSDFLKRLKNKEVHVDSVYAAEILDSDLWRLKEVDNSALTGSGTNVKYYRETGNGIQVYPSGASNIKYPYVKVPGTLAGGDNTDLTKDIEDLTILFTVEKLMGTQRGDFEIAAAMLQERGIEFEKIARNT